MRRDAIQKRERKQPRASSTIAVECHPCESQTNGASNPPPLFFFWGGGEGKDPRGGPSTESQPPPPSFFLYLEGKDLPSNEWSKTRHRPLCRVGRLRCPFTSLTLVYACQARWAGSRIFVEIVRHHTIFAEGHSSTSSQSKKPPDFAVAHFRIVSIVQRKKKRHATKGETLQLLLSTAGRKAGWNVFKQATSRRDTRGRRKPTEVRKKTPTPRAQNRAVPFISWKVIFFYFVIWPLGNRFETL